MREFITQDGKRLHLPDTKQRTEPEPSCDCHERMGNDFYFLPTGCCIRLDKMCNKPRPA